MHIRSPLRLHAQRSALWVIDLQEKLCPVIPGAHQVEAQVLRLITAANLLSIPTAATVQYPKGLGTLIPSLREHLTQPEEKVEFSAAVCRDNLELWMKSGRDQIVVTGIESHICVLQTVLDLLAEGLRPYVIADAIAARRESDHEVALARMRDAGATILSAESALFEWLGTADRPEFKAISRLVKG
ncbi:MAG: isochorismatase family protein [Rubripirellula sp.]